MQTFSDNYFFYIYYVCGVYVHARARVRVCACVCGTVVTVVWKTGQLVGVGSVLLPCRSWRMNANHQDLAAGAFAC